MSEVLQANIFFFVTGIAVIIFTFLLSIALYHLIRILILVRKVMDRIEAGSEIIADDMMHFRKYFTEQSPLARFVAAFFGRREGSRESSRGKGRSARTADTTELKISNKE